MTGKASYMKDFSLVLFHINSYYFCTIGGNNNYLRRNIISQILSHNFCKYCIVSPITKKDNSNINLLYFEISLSYLTDIFSITQK